MSQCSASTQKGKQCQREVSHKAGDDPQYCYQHQSLAKHSLNKPQVTVTTIKPKVPFKMGSYQAIFKKIFDSTLDDTCFAMVKDNLWKLIKPHVKKDMTRSEISAFRDQVHDEFELYVGTSRDEYLKHMKELEVDNPTLVEENVYVDEYIDGVWEVNIEKNDFDGWLMDGIGQSIENWSVIYKDEDEDDVGFVDNEPLRDEIRNAHIDSISTALKTCYN